MAFNIKIKILRTPIDVGGDVFAFVESVESVLSALSQRDSSLRPHEGLPGLRVKIGNSHIARLKEVKTEIRVDFSLHRRILADVEEIEADVEVASSQVYAWVVKQ